MQIQTNAIHEKLCAAKSLYAGMLDDEKALFFIRDEIMVRGWKLGRILVELKEQIGHGKWLLWLSGNLPELGERRSQLCMSFFKANEDWRPLKSVEFLGFEIESVRKFMWGYVPAKGRLQLEGDEEIKPGAHHLTFVNQFSKYDRQLRNGHIESFQLELFRREVEPMVRRIVELCGWTLVM